MIPKISAQLPRYCDSTVGIIIDDVSSRNDEWEKQSDVNHRIESVWTFVPIQEDFDIQPVFILLVIF